MRHRTVCSVWILALASVLGCSGNSDDGGATGASGSVDGGSVTGGTATMGSPVSASGGTTVPGEPRAESGGATGGAAPATGGVTEAAGGAAPATGGVTEATGGAAPATGGTAGTPSGGSGGGVSASGGSGGGTTGGDPTLLPTPTSSCPSLVTGMVDFLGSSVSLSVGPASTPGPVLFYWHATGMTYTEVDTAFGEAIADVEANGGVVASFTTTTGQGTNTGNGVWYTGDLDVADEVLACALEQGLVDTQRIHVSGYSAGGLQCAAMSYLRSGYVASVLCMSGGFMFGLSTYALQDPAHVPAAIAAHGAAGSDVLILDFAACSETYCADVADQGGLAIDCNDGGDHLLSMSSRASTMGAVAWQFFAENRFDSDQRYPSGLPGYFPSYCSIVE